MLIAKETVMSTKFSPNIPERRGVKQHQVTTRGRRFTTSEMLSLFHMDSARLRRPETVTTKRFHGMIGNSMCVNVLEALLVMVQRAAPSILRAPHVRDNWSKEA